MSVDLTKHCAVRLGPTDKSSYYFCQLLFLSLTLAPPPRSSSSKWYRLAVSLLSVTPCPRPRLSSCCRRRSNTSSSSPAQLRSHTGQRSTHQLQWLFKQQRYWSDNFATIKTEQKCDVNCGLTWFEWRDTLTLSRQQRQATRRVLQEYRWCHRVEVSLQGELRQRSTLLHLYR